MEAPAQPAVIENDEDSLLVTCQRVGGREKDGIFYAGEDVLGARSLRLCSAVAHLYVLAAGLKGIDYLLRRDNQQKQVSSCLAVRNRNRALPSLTVSANADHSPASGAVAHHENAPYSGVAG
jgi:hypothetical protein